MDNETRERLLFLNPWHADRAAFQEATERRLPKVMLARAVAPLEADTKKATLIVGPRQAGKSTWVWSQLAGLDPATVLVIDCEDSLLRALCSSAIGFLRAVKGLLPSVSTVFLEEAQNLEEAGLFIKGLVDSGLGLVVWATGSSSYHLQARTRESLAGRAQRRRMLPLSLAEELGGHAAASPLALASRADAVVARQWVLGGYPGVLRSSKPAAELNDLLEAFVLRDASDRFRIQRPDAFRRLIQLAGGQVGSLVNLAEWASLLSISASTVDDYLGLLEETWILRRVPAFAGGKRSEISSARRIHFVDPGIRSAAIGTFSDDLLRRPDRGALAEGWVFAELLKTLPEDWGIHYWRARGGAEMDFVLVRGTRIVGVEVKAGVRPGLSRSAHSFVDAYQPEALVVVSSSSAPAARVGTTDIHLVSFAELATRVSAIVQNHPG